MTVGGPGLKALLTGMCLGIVQAVETEGSSGGPAQLGLWKKSRILLD